MTPECLNDSLEIRKQILQKFIKVLKGVSCVVVLVCYHETTIYHVIWCLVGRDNKFDKNKWNLIILSVWIFQYCSIYQSSTCMYVCIVLSYQQGKHNKHVFNSLRSSDAIYHIGKLRHCYVKS